MSGARLVDRVLGALADPHRRRVIELLSVEPRRAGDLAREVGLAPPSMSRHLRALREARLVEEDSPMGDARVRIYRLRPQPMAHLKAWLEDAERAWNEQAADGASDSPGS